MLMRRRLVIVMFLLSPGVLRAESSEQVKCMKHISSNWSAPAQVAARTDCQFYADNLISGADSWVKYADENVSTSFAQGRNALRAGTTGMYARPSFRLEWYPETASDHGSFVVTTGRSVRSWFLPDHSLKLVRGHYLTVWQRQPDGRYLFIYDVGEDDPA
jgi:hypothetical protein